MSADVKSYHNWNTKQHYWMTLSDKPVMLSDGMLSFWVDGSPWPAMIIDSKD